MKVLIPLAEGFEEIEAVTIIDTLRRAEIDAITAYLEKNPVSGSHNIQIIADIGINDIEAEEIDAIILPGGMPGSENIKNNAAITSIIKKIYKKKGIIGAICAAPIALGALGALEGKNATCYPGFENQLKGATVCKKPVVADGNIITGNAAGSALHFALEVVRKIKGEDVMLSLKEKMRIN